MIINFSVKNFRSIKDWVTLSFEAGRSSNLEDYYILKPKEGMRLLKLGIIYGPNASGKTNILLALNYLRNLVLKPFNKKSESFSFEPFLFDSESRNNNTFFSLEFIQNGIKYLYEIELNKEAVIKESLYFHKPNKALVYERTTDIQKQIAKITFGSKIKIPKEDKDILIGNTLWNNSVLGGYLKTNFESEELQEIIDWFENRLVPIVRPKTYLLNFISEKVDKNEIKKKNIIEILKKADFGVSDFIIKHNKVDMDKAIIDFIVNSLEVPHNEIDEIKNTGKMEVLEMLLQHSIGNSEYLLPMEYESAGTMRYFELGGILSFIIQQNKILSVDELESSLHPDLIKHFLITFLVNSKNSQIITTTHLRELLMEKDILRNDVIWFTDKKKDGSTDLFSLADFDSSVIRNTSSIYNSYKIGKIGAVPNLNDYYIDFGNENK